MNRESELSETTDAFTEKCIKKRRREIERMLKQISNDFVRNMDDTLIDLQKTQRDLADDMHAQHESDISKRQRGKRPWTVTGILHAGYCLEINTTGHILKFMDEELSLHFACITKLAYDYILVHHPELLEQVPFVDVGPKIDRDKRF